MIERQTFFFFLKANVVCGALLSESLCICARPVQKADEQRNGKDRERCEIGAEANKRHVSPHPPNASSFLQISAVQVLELSARFSFGTQDTA